jgi:CO/xanthine dehydrogenase FAD-binding subunit
MTALDATFVLRSEQGERTLSADEFFVDVMTTVLKPVELLVEIRVPQTAPGTGWSFQEVSRRYGDFALMGVAGLIALKGDGTIDRAKLVFTGAKPVAAKAAETLIGRKPDLARFADVANAAADELDPESDIHASAEYRREVGKALARRALEQAAMGAALR